MRVFKFILIICILSVGGYFGYLYLTEKEDLESCFLASDDYTVAVYDEDFNHVDDIIRGKEVQTSLETVDDYTKIYIDEQLFLVKSDNLVIDNNVVLEKEKYVRSSVTVYEDASSIKISGMIPKGSLVEIMGYNKLNSDGSVEKYQIRYNDLTGYIYGKYTVNSEEEANEMYDNGYLQTHLKRTDRFGGGSGDNLDYYPYPKASFEDNVMPDEVRSFYINVGALSNIDAYITLAKESNINAFVVDIKENTVPGYESEVLKEYSPTNYEHAVYSASEYKTYIDKIKDAGIYLIGRISTFKDGYYVTDHPEHAIVDKENNPYKYNNSYWPTAYNRKVWEYNVALAIEAVEEFGFNEIQFDYVRFPDRTYSLEKSGAINLNNTYNETKAQAIQSFLMYACDEIHKVNAYVSADVFGESANSYVTGYGQYWAAISNIVDVISAMPYPDHFNSHDYGIEEYVWEVPYKLLKYWGASVVVRQQETTTPAIVRTWIQAYNTIRSPYVVYDADKISEQIEGLYENGLTGGYMTWNSASSLSKYREISSAFKKVY